MRQLTAATEFRENVRRVFEPAGRGIVGIVDELLAVFGDEGFCIEWRDQHCLIAALANSTDLATEIHVPKSVFRAILARVAALCNERHPDSVSPYGGMGEFCTSANAMRVFHATFANRSGEQRLEITSAAPDA